MRALILVAGAALAVSACSSNESVNNTVVEENVAVDANAGVADLNAVDANMTMDANAMDMNATDANMSMNSADANMANGSNAM
jgi:hypothetical protein